MNGDAAVKVICGWCDKSLAVPLRDIAIMTTLLERNDWKMCKWFDEDGYAAQLTTAHGICEPCLARKFPRRIAVDPTRVRPETLVFNNTLHDLFVFMWGTDKGDVRIEICGDNRIPKAGASVILRNDFNTVSMHGDKT